MARSLTEPDLAQEVSGDVVLKKDRGGSGRLNLFMNGQRSMNGVAHDDLLLRVLIGEPAHQLSARFLMDKVEIGNIVHVLETRYREVFRYIADARMQGLKRGYVERAGKRRYLEGFGSSNIEKRNTAQVTCCRWLLQY